MKLQDWTVDNVKRLNSVGIVTVINDFCGVHGSYCQTEPQRSSVDFAEVFTTYNTVLAYFSPLSYSAAVDSI